MLILNLTQHAVTPDQSADGCLEPKDKKSVQNALTFTSLPSKEEIESRAQMLTALAIKEMDSVPGMNTVCIAGAPYLMGCLEHALKAEGIRVCYSFTQRVSVDKPLPDGSCQKTLLFKHQGFIEV